MILRLIILILLSCVLGNTFAQAPDFSFNLSKKHLNKIERLKSPAAKLRRYRKYYSKDSSKIVKRYDRLVLKKADSVRASMLSSIAESKERLNQKLSTNIDRVDFKLEAARFVPDHLKNEVEVLGSDSYERRKELMRWYIRNGYHKIDSAGEGLFQKLWRKNDKFLAGTKENELLSKTGLPKVPHPAEDFLHKAKGTVNEQINNKEMARYSKELKLYKKQYGQYLNSPDSLKLFASKRGEELLNRQMANAQMGSLKEFQSYQKQFQEIQKMRAKYKDELANLQDSAYVKEKAKEKATQVAMDYVQQHPELISGVQKKMSFLMKKYSSVANSNDLGSAVKRTSLKGRTFKERLVIASNIQILNINPASADLSPLLGYKFNSRLAAGIGGYCRLTFKDSIAIMAPKVFGYKTFLSHDVLNSFFIYGEFTRSTPGVAANETGVHRIWKNALFVGIGKKFSVNSKINMTLTLVYNIIHKNFDSVYPKPFAVRIGFQLSDIALLKKKPEMPPFK